jgi:hypothetical protein
MVDWTGSNAAAWAQAILSGLAIWYSGRLAFRQARAAKIDRVDTYVEMLHVACRNAAVAVEVAKDLARHNTSIQGKGQGFATLSASLLAVPFHEVPDHRLVAIIHGSARACDDLARTFDLRMEGALPFGLPETISIEAANRILNEYRIEAEAISNELMSIAEKLRFAAWRAGSTMRDMIKRPHRRTPRNPED